MGSMSHTNPVTGESFGKSQVFTRGRTIVADGGEAGTAEDDDEQAADDEDVARLRDVDHTPREGAPDTSAVYERGGEGTIEEQDGETEDVPDGEVAEE